MLYGAAFKYQKKKSLEKEQPENLTSSQQKLASWAGS